MDSSVGILFRVITLLVLFLISDDHSHSHALQSPFCFGNKTQSTCSLSVSVDYPIKANLYSDNSCGYPGFEVECDPYKYDGRPFMSISNHIYVVKNIDYGSKQIMLVEGSGGGCPQPNLNFSYPSSPSWVNYYNYGNRSLTVFYNCSSVPADAEKHLHCSTKDTNTPPSYAFYYDETREGFDWYGNCAKNVVVPAFYTDASYSNAIKQGFYMGWSATDWCKDCERSGGQCWSRPDNSNGCACKNNLSFKRTCLPDWCTNCESSGGQCWSNSTVTVCTCQNGESYNRTCPQQQTSPLHPGVPRTPSIVSKSPYPKDGLSTGLKIGIGVLSGIGGVLLVALLIFCKRLNHSSLCVSYWWNKKKSPIDIEVFLEKYGCLALQRYKYSEIRKMTNSFKDILGQGGYGRVFKGELHDGRLVAVKLNESKGDGEDFINEVATIGRTNHVNVVNLVGFCIEGTRRALVYEFMPNGSLERFIYTQNESSTTLPLGWEKLYQIALGIARGLEYLHRGCNTRILHFDIKPHNILLDQNFCPKISDFGLAKLYPLRESIVSRVGTRGTVGYIAPELYNRTFGNVSHKSDVYSYGMMMLEMTGGRKNIDVTVENISEIYFPLWIYNHLKRHYDAKGLEEIQATEVFEDEKAKKMILVALWCIQAHPVDRPSMSKVVEMLEGNTHELQMPPNPSVDPRSSYSTSL